jgi:isocitrate lyase
MKTLGIFSEVNNEIGEIIVADVNRKRMEELLAPDGRALQELIQKRQEPEALSSAETSP